MDGQKPANQSNERPQQFAPGDTVSPRLTGEAPTELPTPSSIPPEPPETANGAVLPQPQAYSQPQQPAATETAQASTPTLQAQEPAQEQADVHEAPTTYWQGDPAEVVNWTASEFISHQKTQGWYSMLILGSLLFSVVVWLVTKDIVSAVIVLMAGVVLASYATRKPRELTYQIDPSGLTIGERHYSYNEFRSFSVTPEGAFSSLVFTPLKRFGVLTTVYFDPQDEERIANIVTRYLPHEEHKPDPIDHVMRRIRF